MSSLTTLRISTSKGVVVVFGVAVVTEVVADVDDAVVVVVVVVVTVVNDDVDAEFVVVVDSDEDNDSGVVELILMRISISFSSVTDV